MRNGREGEPQRRRRPDHQGCRSGSRGVDWPGLDGAERPSGRRSRHQGTGAGVWPSISTTCRIRSDRRCGLVASARSRSSFRTAVTMVFSHPYFVEVLEGVTAVASAHDLAVVLSTGREEEDGEAAYVRLLRTRRADGVIVAAAAIGDLNISRLAASGYPPGCAWTRPAQHRHRLGRDRRSRGGRSRGRSSP